MSFYGELADLANGLLLEFGDVGALRRAATAGEAAYDPATGLTTPDPDPLEERVIAAVFDYDEKAIDGSLIQVGDKQVYVSVVALVKPTINDVFIWQGIEYKIIRHKELAPAGENVLYEWQVRA